MSTITKPQSVDVPPTSKSRGMFIDRTNQTEIESVPARAGDEASFSLDSGFVKPCCYLSDFSFRSFSAAGFGFCLSSQL